MGAGTSANGGRRARLLRLGIVTLAILVALVAWLATRSDDGGSPADTEAAPPRIVSPQELANVPAVVGHPVYWAGPISGTRLELTEGPEGNVQVRYLQNGAKAGDGGTEFLTIGSYPLADPAAATENVVKQPGSSELTGAGGRQVVVNQERPTSAYFASPDNSVQVEVYDPSPKRALSLAASEQVRPAG